MCNTCWASLKISDRMPHEFSIISSSNSSKDSYTFTHIRHRDHQFYRNTRHLLSEGRWEVEYSIAQQPQVSSTVAGESQTSCLYAVCLPKHLVEQVEHYHPVPGMGVHSARYEYMGLVVEPATHSISMAIVSSPVSFLGGKYWSFSIKYASRARSYSNTIMCASDIISSSIIIKCCIYIPPRRDVWGQSIFCRPCRALVQVGLSLGPSRQRPALVSVCGSDVKNGHCKNIQRELSGYISSAIASFIPWHWSQWFPWLWQRHRLQSCGLQCIRRGNGIS